MGLTRREKDRVEEILGGDAAFVGQKQSLRLIAGTGERMEELTERVPTDSDAGAWVADAEGPAITLDVDVWGRIPEELEGEPVTLEVITEGIAVRQFTGTLLRPQIGKTTSKLQAASSGFWLQKILLLESVSYTGVRPDLVVGDALGRAPYAGPVEVQRVDRPLIVRSGDEAFRLTDALDDVLEAVQEEVPYVFHDTPHDGSEATLAKRLSEGGEPAWTFEVGRDVDAEDFSPERQGDSYFEVIVTRQGEDSAAPVEILARVPVPGSKAPPGAVLNIESSDQSASASASALSTAYDEAHGAAYGRYRASVTVPYIQPFLRRGRFVAMQEGGSEETVRWGETLTRRYTRTWMCLLDSVGGSIPSKRGTYGGMMEVVGKVREPVVLPPPPTASGGVFFPLLGWDWLGRAYLSTDLPFVSYDEATGEAVVDSQAAAEHGVNVYMDEETREVVVDDAA